MEHPKARVPAVQPVLWFPRLADAAGGVFPQNDIPSEALEGGLWRRISEFCRLLTLGRDGVSGWMVRRNKVLLRGTSPENGLPVRPFPNFLRGRMPRRLNGPVTGPRVCENQRGSSLCKP